MKLYVLVTKNDQSSDVISGIYSNKDKMISALSTIFKAEDLSHVELWDLDNGFIDYVNVSKKTVITIED